MVYVMSFIRMVSNTIQQRVEIVELFYGNMYSLKKHNEFHQSGSVEDWRTENYDLVRVVEEPEITIVEVNNPLELVRPQHREYVVSTG